MMCFNRIFRSATDFADAFYYHLDPYVVNHSSFRSPRTNFRVVHHKERYLTRQTFVLCGEPLESSSVVNENSSGSPHMDRDGSSRFCRCFNRISKLSMDWVETSEEKKRRELGLLISFIFPSIREFI